MKPRIAVLGCGYWGSNHIRTLKGLGALHAVSDANRARAEGFASEHGPKFYGLPLNGATITLERGETIVPDRIGEVVPFHAGETLHWRLV